MASRVYHDIKNGSNEDSLLPNIDKDILDIGDVPIIEEQSSGEQQQIAHRLIPFKEIVAKLKHNAITQKSIRTKNKNI